MLEVEGKTFRKLVEKKEYRTNVYSNSCPLSESRVTQVWRKKTGESYYSEDLFLDEDNYVANYGNTLASVDFTRKRVFIEEGDDKISLKYQFYSSTRRVGSKFFLVRKITRFLTFSFKTKLFYSGVYSSKKKAKIGSSMKVNPNYYVISQMIDTINGVDKKLDGKSYVYNFLESIWDKLGLVDPQNFETYNPQQFYSLTFYLVNGLKLPNTWKQLTGMFVPKDQMRKNNFNLVDAFMSYYNLKGSKIKKLINECDDIDFNRLALLYDLLGIDRFNKLDDKIFSQGYVVNDVIGRLVQDQQYMMGGMFWSLLWKLDRKETSTALSILTNKEKDRIANLNLHLQEETVQMIKDHVRYKIDLKRLGENVKMKFNNMDELISEHEEWSRLIQSYRTGEVERYYGEVDVLETPIIYNDETYYPILLKKTEDYEKESQHQRNCVRTYSQRPDCMIFSIRKESPTGEERVTVEYQFRQKEILNVQERARFNGMPSHDFSEVARVQLANINLMYKLGTLKLPKMIKKYRNGRVIEQQSVFKSVETVEATVNGVMGKMIRMTPSWDNNTPELDTYGDGYDEQVPLTPINYDNFLDELP